MSADDNDTPPARVVEVVATDTGFALHRDGEPYVIHGVGGNMSAAALDLLVKHGGNSTRTWGVGADTRAALDRAHERGLTTTVGFWFPHQNDDVDYADPQVRERVRESVRRGVLELRDHPAVLIWALGNEMEHGVEDRATLYRFVNDVALMVKRLDPHRPVMTVIADVGGDKVSAIHEHAPAIDIVGINSYAGAATVARRYREAGGTKPYILTEFGPIGPWESATTTFDAAIEPTSTQKADQYRKHYERAVANELGQLCLGSYAFLWGHKQESTATWFGLFRPYVPEGESIQTHAAVDVMQELWTGVAPAPTAPVIAPLALDADVVTPGQPMAARFTVTDPNGDPLDLHWEIRHDTLEVATMGASRPVDQLEPTEFNLALDRPGVITFMAPGKPGFFRLYLYATDGKGRFASANAPFHVAKDAPTP
ncbi:MAG: glycoside hydrolase family 2 TIM barrel-domain containing protein [Planctomycetota bacterium]